MWVLVTGKVAVNSNVNPLLSNKCPPPPPPPFQKYNNQFKTPLF